VPAASTVLVDARVDAISAGSMPSEASLAFEASTKIFSSCAPASSTLFTSATRRNSLRAASYKLNGRPSLDLIGSYTYKG
jgi:hypothetical protein